MGPKVFFHKIEVGFKPPVRNVFAEGLLASAKEQGFKLTKVDTVDAYALSGLSGLWNLERIAKDVLADPLLQDFSVNEPLALRQGKRFDFAVEVSFKPGVTDNVGRTVVQAVKDVIPAFAGQAFASRQYLLSGKLALKDVELLIATLVANGLIERWIVKDWASFVAEEGFAANPPIAGEEKLPVVEMFDLASASVSSLVRLSDDRLLALSEDELKAVKHKFSQKNFVAERKKAGFSEKITDAELECIGQTWSEHCKHKIFNALIAYEGPAGRREKIDSLFKAFIKKSTDEISRKKPGFLLSVFKDNAGIFRFNKDWNIAVKVETHNSPCALDPFGGAVTGIVGVNRDVLGAGLGARPIFNTDVFCFAAPDYAGVYPRVHPKFMLRGVVRGIQDGGNKSGIPTINGSITFDDSFAGKPLVYCGTGGIMPAKLKGGRATHEKKARPGDLVFMVGGRVGKDGIHGATFSSLGLAEDSPVSAVQIGDPFTQKKVIDFVLEVRDAGLVGSITDCGAGGLSSSVGEMALQSGGAELRLEKVPLKYAGLQPWEVLLSEAQERMTIAVSPANREKFLELARKHEVEASEIGVFTKTGFFHVLHSGKPVLHLDLDFLHSPPQLQLKAKARKIVSKPFTPASQKDYSGILKKILFSWNVCSKEEIVRRYDHEVQGTSVLKPFVGAENDGPGDAAVLKPVYSSNEGLVVSHGLSPKYSKLDAYLMAANALDEAVRNAVAVGGSLEKMVCLDNFCWPDPVFSKGNPDGMEKLGDLVEANNALYDLTRAYGVPCVSGKDSMKNDAFVKGKKISVLPTLLFTVVSVVPDVSKSVSMDFKAGGDVVFVLGETRNELGESEFSKALGLKGGCAPAVDGKANKNLYDALEKAVSQGLVASCHDCSDGGFAVALSESAFAGGLGAQVDLRSMLLGEGAAFDVVALFSESSGRFVASASAKNERAFADLMRKHGVKFARVGVVGGKKLSVLGLNGRKILDEGVLELKKAWKSRRWF